MKFKFLLCFGLLLFVQLLLTPPEASAAGSRTFPDRVVNPDSIRGIVSTGYVGDDQDKDINPFYGSDSWVKVYLDTDTKPEELTARINFEGGATRDDLCSGSDHPVDQIRVHVIKGKENGRPINDGRKEVEAGSCSYSGASIIIYKNDWSDNRESESGKYVAFIRINIFQKDENGNDYNQLWGDFGQGLGPEDPRNHLKRHPNHPSRGFVVSQHPDEFDGYIEFGNWSLYSSTGTFGNSQFLLPTEDAGKNYVFNTYISNTAAVPTSQRKRTFEFAPSCELGGSQTIWLKWYDDDFNHDKSETYMEMELIEYEIKGENTDGSPKLGPAVKVESITGYNGAAADKYGLSGSNPWRQGNRTNINPYDGSYGGEGFGGQGFPGKAKVTVRKDHVYRWVFKAVGPKASDISHKFGNRMAVWLPFDTAYAGEKDCRTEPIPVPTTCNNIKFNMTNSTTRNKPGGGTESVDNWHYGVWVNDYGSASAPNTAYTAGTSYDWPINTANRDFDSGQGGVGRNDPIDRNLVASNKIVSGTLQYTVVQYSRYKNNKGVQKFYVHDVDTKSRPNCYMASCEVSIAEDDLPGPNNVKANSWFKVTTTITNQGVNTLPRYINTNISSPYNSYGLSATTFGDGKWGPAPDPGQEWYGIYRVLMPYGINPGETTKRDFWFKAPNNIGAHSVRSLPDYWGGDGLGDMNGVYGDDTARCSAPINTYKQFDITPSASITSMDDEEPGRIDYRTGGSNGRSDAPVNVNWDRQLYRKRGGVNTTLNGVFNSNNTFGNISENRVFNAAGTSLVPGTLQPGDQVCAWTRINTTDGWVGPGNSILLASAKPAVEDCDITTNKPYMRVYGNDLYAGSGFTNSAGCTTNSAAAVRGYQSSNANKLGSGAQLAILANGIIQGYMSSAVRSFAGDPARAPAGLSFANTSADAAANNYGGDFGVSFCATNFFDTTQYEDTDRTNKTVLPGNQTLSADSLDKLQTLIKEGDLNFTGGIIEDRRAVYVEGDVYISDNIGHDSAARSNFAMIVKGDIYVGKNVRLLDGLYVAQPRADGTGGGTIYTCAESLGNPVDKTQLYNQCGGAQKDDAVAGNERQLVVYGAFIAQDVKFLRTHGSLRDTSRSSEGANINNAAELFRFSPELYLTFPAFKPRPLGGAGIFDYITTLPPIL